MEPGGSMSYSQELSIMSILPRTNQIPHIDTYLFKKKKHSCIALPSEPRPSRGLIVDLPVNFLKALLSCYILAKCPVQLKLVALIPLTMVQAVKLLLYFIYIFVNPSPLLILIPLVPKC